MKKIECCLSLLFLMLLGAVPAAATIVRMDVTYGAQAAGSLYLELFDAAAPATVSNFLNYIQDASGDRRYDGTFVHRSVPGFVIQGGGYAYDPALGDFGPGTAPHIATDAPVVNEFDAARSNVRGTIAMAKQGGDPDSATSEWFINLGDNSANLDTQNGGFTVFGRVLGNGMGLVDAVAALGVVNLGGPFSQLPVADTAKPVTSDNLVVISRVVTNPPAAISTDGISKDFGLVALNTGPASMTLTLQNIGGQDLVLGTVGDTDGLVSPFRIAAGGDGCSGRRLVATASCTIVLEFEPVVLGAVVDTFNVPSNDAIRPNLVVSLTGSGAPQTPTLDVSPQTVVDFGSLGTGEPRTRTITVTNVGGGQLEPLQPVISGADAASFSLSADGCTGTMLAIGQSCTLSVSLSTLTVGPVSASLSIVANPGPLSTQLSMTGTVTLLQPAIGLPSSLSFGDTQASQSITATLSMSNDGADDLFLSGIEFMGKDAALFSVGTECIGLPIAASSGCNAEITFSAVQTGTYAAVARISSNDPLRSTVDVALDVTVSEDGDGIPDAIEDMAPNQGDANRDGIPDRMQARVASVPDANGRFIMIEVPDGMLLSGVSLIDDPSAGGAPTIAVGTLDFSYGFFAFSIDNVPKGGEVSVTFRLPDGQSANGYFKYGRLPGEFIFFPPHWYDFAYNPATRTGAKFSGNLITLNYVDGGRGDNDQLANGRIVDPGGPAVISVDGTDSSGGGGCSLSVAELSQRQKPVGLILLLAGMIFYRLLRGRRTVPVC